MGRTFHFILKHYSFLLKYAVFIRILSYSENYEDNILHSLIKNIAVRSMTIKLAPQSKLTTIKLDTRMLQTLKVQTVVLHAIHDFFYRKDFIQLMPVILSQITDPLCHSVYEPRITYLGQGLQLTKSMIFHKQLAIASLGCASIYVMSPNIRFEINKLKTSGKHLLEFTQLDIEMKDTSAHEFMSLIEDLIISLIIKVKNSCGAELEKNGIKIRVPKKPFKEFWSWDLREEYGEEYEKQISLQEKDLFWITDFEREFYDKEDPDKKGHYINYDLYYPYGFGEALSGGEREYEYNILVKKIKERNQDLKAFELHLDLAKKALLVPSAGGGLGIERLIRFLTKRKHIKDATLFPKLPGERIEF